MGSREPNKDSQGNPIFSTVCHGGNKHKLYYYDDSKSFHCYTDCSENMDIFEIVVRAKKQQGFTYTFPQSIQYVAQLTGKTFGFSSVINSNSSEIIDDWKWINRHKKKEKITYELPEYDSTVMSMFLPYPHEAWLNEGISYETQMKFNIKYYFREFEESIVIPHYDLNNRLIGIRKRSLLEDALNNGRKYMPVSVDGATYNHSTMMSLYGLHKTQNSIKNIKKIMFFEGEKSVLKCQDYYGDLNFTCAVCSSSISNFHRDIALSLGVEEVFIAFDKFREKEKFESEEVYQEKIINYQEKLIKYAKKFVAYCRVYILWDFNNDLNYKDSPADQGKKTLEILMKNKIEITTDEVISCQLELTQF